jgi:hypothetical protein
MELKAAIDGLVKDGELKKPYHKPAVIIYGNIREITRNVGPKGTDDNGGGAAAGPKTGI